MLNTCKLCGKQFKAKVYNNYICNEPHYINCRICHQPVYMNGESNKKKRKMYFDKGYVYCSHSCSCKGNGLDKYNEANKDIDLEKLKYLKTQTSMSDKAIAETLNLSVDFVKDRCERNNWRKPEVLKEKSRVEKNIRISNTLKQKYKDLDVKNAMLQKAKKTYRAKTGYDHNFKNPTELEKYKRIKFDRYGNSKFTNPDKMKHTRLVQNDGVFWNKLQLEKLKQSYKNKSDKDKQLMQQRKKQTKLERYGNKTYCNPSQISYTLKNKSNEEKQAIQTKIKQTKLERYGDENYNNITKRTQTFVDKYNVNNFDYIHLTEKNYAIISDPDKFKEFLLSIPYDTRTTYCCRNLLGLSQAGFNSIYHKYRCDDIDINQFNSKFEQEVKNFITSIVDFKIISNNRSIIKPYELDIYIPEKKLAIECNGTYWHSSKLHSDKNYHYNKSVMCEKKNIRLIHIFEYEWYNDRQRPILENIIKNALGVNTNKIYARKLNIEIHKSTDMREFFDKNNIQGFRGGKFAICLVDKNTKEVYMSYMMGYPFFGKGKYQWEVIRGATKLGYTVVGGASKIFNYFVKTYNPTNCVYYIDYNYFNGNSLKNLPQMEFIKTQPSFKNYWVATGEVKNREPHRHKEIKQLTAQNLVIPIYNAGTKVYVWKRE